MSDITGDKIPDKTLDETTERIVSELTTRLLQPLANSVTGALNEAIPTLEPALAELQRPVQQAQGSGEVEGEDDHERKTEQDNLDRLDALVENGKLARQTQQQIIELQAELLKFEAEFSKKLDGSLEKSLEGIAQSIKQSIDQSTDQGRSESLQAFQAIQDALAQFEQRLGQRLVVQFEQRLEQKLDQKLDRLDRFERSMKNILSEERRTLAPALASSLETSLESSLASSASSLQSSLAQSLESALASSLAQSLESTLTPVLSQSLAQNLTTAVTQSITNELSGLRDNLSESLNDGLRDTFGESMTNAAIEPVLNASQEIKRLVHDGFAASATNAGNTKIILTNSLAKLESIIKNITALTSVIDNRDHETPSGEVEQKLTLLADELACIRADIAAASERASLDKKELLGSVKHLSDVLMESEQEASHDEQSARDITKQLLEVNIPGWEGMLRAHNQAQSRELDTLSSELTNLQNQSEATIIQALQDTLNTEFAAHVAVLDRRANADRLENAKWAKSIKNVLWLLAGFAGLSILFSVANIFR